MRLTLRAHPTHPPSTASLGLLVQPPPRRAARRGARPRITYGPSYRQARRRPTWPLTVALTLLWLLAFELYGLLLGGIAP